MRFSVFILAGLGLSGLCIGLSERMTNATEASAALASISAFKQELEPPTSIRAELSGIPTNVAAAITNPAGVISLANDFAHSIPGWFQSLPPDAQSYLIGIGPKVIQMQSRLVALQSIAGVGFANVTVTPLYNNATATRDCRCTAASTTTTTSIMTATASASGGALSVATSTSRGAAAPQQTAILAASVMGAISVLGLAIAL